MTHQAYCYFGKQDDTPATPNLSALTMAHPSSLGKDDPLGKEGSGRLSWASSMDEKSFSGGDESSGKHRLDSSRASSLSSSRAAMGGYDERTQVLRLEFISDRKARVRIWIPCRSLICGANRAVTARVRNRPAALDFGVKATVLSPSGYVGDTHC